MPIDSYRNPKLSARPEPTWTARRVSDQIEEPGLDIHVNVLQLRLPGEGAVADLLFDIGQPTDDGLGVLLRDDALPGEHAGVRHGAGDILLVETPVIVDGNGVSAEISHGNKMINPRGSGLKECYCE